jgi:hypothetical protein
MERTSRKDDPMSALVDLLAEALAARRDFPPRASSAAAAIAAQVPRTPEDAGPRRRGRRHTTPAQVARFAGELLEALATRLDFPPRASSAAAAIPGPAPAEPVRREARPGKRRRSPAQVGRLTARLLAHVQSNPGEPIEEIARALRQSTRALALPARNLLAQGRIRTRRVRGETRYYAAGAGPIHETGRDSR